jgi:hypothetical protein
MHFIIKTPNTQHTSTYINANAKEDLVNVLKQAVSGEANYFEFTNADNKAVILGKGVLVNSEITIVD